MGDDADLPAKKPRLQASQGQAVALVPAQLAQFLPDPAVTPSPGAVSACRIAARVSGVACEAYFAHGSSLRKATLALQPHVHAESGREGVLIPTAAQAASTSLVYQGRRGAEVQSVVLLPSQDPHAVDWLGSVDAYGRACIQRLPHQGHLEDTPPGEPSPSCSSLNLEPPTNVGNREAGWAGLALSAAPGGSSLSAATALRLGKAVATYQGERLVRCFHTLGLPTAVAWVPALSGGRESVLAVAEGSRMTLWDVRQGEKGGLAQQLNLAPTGDSIFSFAWARSGADGLLASAGEERAVVVTEPRKWKMVSKWQSPVKYSITCLAISHVNPQWCYCSGLDYECVAGRWDASSGGSSGNANSATGGHGRAVGPAGMPGIGGRQGQCAQQRQGQEGGKERSATPGGEEGATPMEGDRAAKAPPSGGAEGEAAPASKAGRKQDGGADDEAPAPKAGRKQEGLSFRSDSRFLGLAVADGCKWLGRPCDVLVSYSQSGHLFMLQTRGQEAMTEVQG